MYKGEVTPPFCYDLLVVIWLRASVQVVARQRVSWIDLFVLPQSMRGIIFLCSRVLKKLEFVELVRHDIKTSILTACDAITPALCYNVYRNVTRNYMHLA